MKQKRYVLSISLIIITLSYAISCAAMSESYVIGDEDMIQISVWGSPELSVQVPVRPDGMISAPLLGDVKATGLTPQELKILLEKDLAKFIKAPTVSVIITAVNSFKVYVLGGGLTGTSSGHASGVSASGVGPSGVITLRRNTTLMQLLAQLGPLKDADLDNGYILREGKKLNVDFARMILKGDASQDIQLKPDDMIFIPDNFEKRIKVVGAVKTPGVLPYRDGLTTLDAILAMGGFTEFAKQNDVVVVRKENGKLKTIEVKLKDVINDGDIQKDILLKPGDHVVVKTGIF
jgi:polysaccharide export outer membrane protein